MSVRLATLETLRLGLKVVCCRTRKSQWYSWSLRTDYGEFHLFVGKQSFVLFMPSTHWMKFTHLQFSSVAQLCLTLWDLMNCSMPGLPVHHHLLEFTQTHIHRVSDTIQPSHPLSSPSPPAPNPSQHQSLFQWVNSSKLRRVSLEQSKLFAWGISPSKEHPGLISFRMEWLDLLAVQGTLKSLLQHHNSKASVLQCFSLLYGPTLTSIHDYWKNHSFEKTDLCQQSNVSAF